MEENSAVFIFAVACIVGINVAWLVISVAAIVADTRLQKPSAPEHKLGVSDERSAWRWYVRPVHDPSIQHQFSNGSVDVVPGVWVAAGVG